MNPSCDATMMMMMMMISRASGRSLFILDLLVIYLPRCHVHTYHNCYIFYLVYTIAWINMEIE
jgi:hypothetical protein